MYKHKNVNYTNGHNFVQTKGHVIVGHHMDFSSRKPCVHYSATCKPSDCKNNGTNAAVIKLLSKGYSKVKNRRKYNTFYRFRITPVR